jgi:hypothetical protein
MVRHAGNDRARGAGHGRQSATGAGQLATGSLSGGGDMMFIFGR